MLNFLQLGEDAVVIKTTPDGSLDLAVEKYWVFSPGTPFQGDATVSKHSMGKALARDQCMHKLGFVVRCMVAGTA